MLRHYVFLVVILSSSFVVYSMKEEMPMDRHFGFVIPRDHSLLSLSSLFNSDDNVQERIELKDLNEDGKQAFTKSPRSAKADCMHIVHNTVHKFFVHQRPDYAGLLKCIYECNYAKRFKIDEDQLGRLAFEHDNTVVVKTSLFFYFLKNYNAKTATTREIPPKTWSPMAERLGIVSIGDSLRTLIADTDALLANKISHYDELISCIHSDQQFSQLGDSYLVVDEDWKSKFLYGAFDMLCSDLCTNKLHDIVMLVTRVKDLKLIMEIRNLGYEALSYETTELDALLMRPWSIAYESKKKPIALLCACIEKYDKARGEKITPSVVLYKAYKAQQSLHLMFPDTFDLSLFDAEKIAFAEYGELLDDINALYDSYPERVEECVKKLYPLQLSTVTK